MAMNTGNLESHDVSTTRASHTGSACKWLSIDMPHSQDPNFVDSMVSRNHTFEGIELRTNHLSASVAKILQKANAEYLFLTILKPLGKSAAGVLGDWPFSIRPIRDITFEHEISAKIAKALMGGIPGKNECDRPLSISVPTITAEVAQVLARHTNELYLTISHCFVDDDIVLALNEFRGKRLFLDSRMGFTKKAKQALFSNPASRITTWSGIDHSVSPPKK